MPYHISLPLQRNLAPHKVIGRTFLGSRSCKVIWAARSLIKASLKHYPLPWIPRKRITPALPLPHGKPTKPQGGGGSPLSAPSGGGLGGGGPGGAVHAAAHPGEDKLQPGDACVGHVWHTPT